MRSRNEVDLVTEIRSVMIEVTHDGRHVVKIVMLALLWIAGAVGCGGGGGASPADDAWAYTDRDVVGPGDQGSSDSINVDLYIDATTSMIGYLAGGSSTYIRFLEELESSVASGWAQSDLDYFKFGSRVRSIDRSAFREASSAAFYRERGLFKTTRIDSVIGRMNRSGISVVVTDLFQNESDINVLVSKIKNEVFRNGLELAVLGVKSEFDGRIYDAKVPAYNYTSTPGDESTYRPFYALMIGEVTELRRLFETLKTSPSVERDPFALISPYIVQDYSVELQKERSARDLNMRSAGGGENRFAFNLRSSGTGGTLRGNLVLDRVPATPDVVADQVELVSYRKTLSRGTGQNASIDSTRTQDLTMRNIQRSGDTLRVILRMNLKDEPAGMYTYKMVFQAGAIGGLKTSAWVQNFSSTNPSPESDPNKTLNLEQFVLDLIQASTSVHQPKLAKAYITVRKF